MDQKTMCVLRVELPSDRFDELIALLPVDRVDASWREGTRRSADRVHTNSGANVFLGEADGAGPAVEEALRTLRGTEKVLDQLRAAGAEFEVDVGVFLSENDWTRSVALDAAELELLARFGIGLVMSAYRGGEGEYGPVGGNTPKGSSSG